MATITKQDIVNQVAKETGLTVVDSKLLFEELLKAIAETLESGDNIEIRGFGTFYTKIRKPRPARNIHTGEVVPLKERAVPLFRFSQSLQDKIDAVQKGGEVTPIFTK